ncbi:probableE424 Na(+), Li(+), K(+)/H(+) antiporter at N-terminal half [Coccomyxa sp. Obi]|nr:probableE424 Na(+), Li(+), K(+)/H(+) antiporter at N-terminal half [Coccomyxa sp. Obi]
MNKNIVATFAFRFSSSLAQGIWDYNALPQYIYILENYSSQAVGLIEGLQGTCTALAGFPAGWVADRTRRDRVLKGSAVVNALAIVLTVYAVLVPQKDMSLLHIDTDNKFLLLCGAMALWGAAYGSWPIVDSLFADSVPTGGRDRIYTLMYSSNYLASAIGPLLAALLFYLRGNSWSLRTLGAVVLIGMAVALIPICTIFMFNDDNSLDSETAPITQSLLSEKDREEGAGEREGVPKGERWLCLRPWAVPYLLAASDTVYGLASGMTIKFFPVFWIREVELSPMAVQGMAAAVPFLLALSSYAMHPLAICVGRVHAISAVKLLGGLLLAWMSVDKGMWRNAPLVVTVYLLRTMANNSTYALQKSILMDFVPKSARARWNSLDSLFVFSWSGSAAFGGFMIAKWGFGAAFLITAILQLVAWAILVPLIWLVPRSMTKPPTSVQQMAPPTGGVEAESCLSSAAAESAALLSGNMQAAAVPIAVTATNMASTSPVGSLR